jgi:hypothetical protein
VKGFWLSVASPRYLEDGYVQQFKLFCTPSCTAVNLYFHFVTISCLCTQETFLRRYEAIARFINCTPWPNTSGFQVNKTRPTLGVNYKRTCAVQQILSPWCKDAMIHRHTIDSLNACHQLLGARNSLLSITNATRHCKTNSHMNWSHESSLIHVCQPNRLQFPLYLRYISGCLNLSCARNVRLLHEQPFKARIFKFKFYVFFAYTV